MAAITESEVVLSKSSLVTRSSGEEEHKSNASDDGTTAASAQSGPGCGCGHHHDAKVLASKTSFDADGLREASAALAKAADAGGLAALDKESRTEVMARCCRVILEAVGEDPARDGLLKTPKRMAKAMLELTRGYEMDAQATLQKALFDVDGGGSMVVVKDIEFSSLCEHHVLPFRGTVHIAYLPGDRVVGLSKLARITDIYAKRLQVQERLTRQIAEAVMEAIGAKGACVLVEAEHMCMSMRGANKPGASTTTLVKMGAFETDPALVAEFRMHVGR